MNLRDRGGVVRRKIGGNLAQNRQRNGRYAIAGIDGIPLSNSLVQVRDAHTVTQAANLRNLALVAYDLSQPLLESRWNAVHPTDGLEHGGLLVDQFFEENVVPQVGIQ